MWARVSCHSSWSVFFALFSDTFADQTRRLIPRIRFFFAEFMYILFYSYVVKAEMWTCSSLCNIQGRGCSYSFCWVYPSDFPGVLEENILLANINNVNLGIGKLRSVVLNISLRFDCTTQKSSKLLHLSEIIIGSPSSIYSHLSHMLHSILIVKSSRIRHFYLRQLTLYHQY